MNSVITRERMSTQIHRYLRDRILSGGLAAGTRLIETEIAAELNVSRTPVREALVQLQGQDLVRPLESGGCMVCNIRQQLLDILDIRIALETYAVRRTAVEINEQELAALKELCEEMEALPSEDVSRRAELNREFHAKLISSANNRRLVKIVNDYQEYFSMLQRLLEPETLRRTQAEHRKIVAAVGRHDADEAARLVTAHIARAGELILQIRPTPEAGE